MRISASQRPARHGTRATRPATMKDLRAVNQPVEADQYNSFR